jgi:hypothetical protein
MKSTCDRADEKERKEEAAAADIFHTHLDGSRAVGRRTAAVRGSLSRHEIEEAKELERQHTQKKLAEQKKEDLLKRKADSASTESASGSKKSKSSGSHQTCLDF